MGAELLMLVMTLLFSGLLGYGTAKWCRMGDIPIGCGLLLVLLLTAGFPTYFLDRPTERPPA